MYDPILYFDEMNLLQSEKDRRIKTSQQFFKAMLQFFAKQLLNLMTGTFLFEHTTEQYEDELMDLYLLMAVDKYDSTVINKAKQFSKYIQETTEKAVREANGNENYRNAITNGLRVFRADIPKSVLYVFSEERAMNIALNETNWMYNYLNHQNLVEAGHLTHTWVSMKDERVRASHVEADNQTVPINEPFIVNGYRMMFPLDDSMGAPVDEIIWCRCVEL